ncbi:hypothetical protein J4405_02640 [Candidatus Woesearchaeota archaeon]|nr:hypothetical protein [Candidatus Woesearchaeota archaeon]
MLKNEDLRNLNEEEFKQVYEYLRIKTENFKTITPSLILENNQYLLIFRICLGLSQKEFAKKLGKTKDWCRHTEAKRNKIEKVKIAERYTKKITELINKKEVKLENSLINWEKYNSFSKDQILPEAEIKLKSFSKLTEENLKDYFDLIKRETNNFTEISSELFIKIPQSILIFRIILGLSYRKFNQVSNISEKQIRNYEHLTNNIKPTLAKKISNIVTSLLINKNIEFQQFLENYRILKGFYGCRDLNFLVNQGLNRLAMIKPTKYEEEIAKLLENQNIKFERYKILNGVKSRFNIDFYVPDKNIAIEVFSYNNCKKRGNIKSKACLVDHRFQSLKSKDSKLRTIMCIRIEGKPILHNYVKNYIDMELLNTDYLLINKEVNNLLYLIK